MTEPAPAETVADSDQPLSDFFIASAPTIQLAIDRYGAQVVVEFFLNMVGMIAAQYEIDMNKLSS